MIMRYRTALVFWGALVFSFLSLGLLFALDSLSLALLIPSILLNIWSIRKNDRSGFVKSKELRRAYEPARHFNGMQVFVLTGLVMCQIGVGTYALLAEQLV